MENCQANDAAVAVIQHLDGGVERRDCSISAEEVMRKYPGHYVALVTLCIDKDGRRAATSTTAVHFTRVRLLKRKDKLLIGHAYRLITSQEVTEALKERKHERIRNAQAELVKQQQQSTTSVEDGLDSGEENAKLDCQKMCRQRNMRGKGRGALEIGGLRCRASQKLDSDAAACKLIEMEEDKDCNLYRSCWEEGRPIREC